MASVRTSHFDFDRVIARDRRIAELEAVDRLNDRDAAELAALVNARDCMWSRLPGRIAAARQTLDVLTRYARDVGFPAKDLHHGN